MPIRPTQVDGGLVTARDPAMLGPGELQRADDAEYHPGDPAIWKVRGRTEFNETEESGSIVGGRYLEFEGGTDLNVIHVGTTYRSATAAETGTFSTLDSGMTGGASLDSVHYNNQHILLNGVDRNRIVNSSGVASLHGMLANTTAPSLSRDAGVGTGFILSSGVVIRYWVEERVKSGSTIVKRNSETGSTIVTLTGDGTTDKPVITRPAVVNSDATHWALYATAAAGSFPTGAEIAEVAIGTTTIEDTRTGTDPSFPSGDDYEIVSIELAGTSTNVAKNGPPPIADTGDVAEDSVVLNDTSDRSKVWYSFWDTPHAFPSTNVIRFETKEADETRCIRTLGHTPIVLMRDSAHRINTLPRPADAAFQPERVKDQIAGAFGCVGPMAACKFNLAGGAELLAYVSRYGLLWTDGYTWNSLCDDLRWDDTTDSAVDVESLASACLTNNPARWRLEMDAVTPSGDRRAYFFHYHPSHIRPVQGGWRLKATGPITREATCAWTAKVSGVDVVFTGSEAGTVYREDSGASDAAGNGIAFVMRTGRLYQGGVMGETKTGKLAVLHTAGASTQTANVRIICHTEGQDDYSPQLRSISMARREKTTAYDQVQGEAIEAGLENSDELGQFAVNALFTDYTPLGVSQP